MSNEEGSPVTPGPEAPQNAMQAAISKALAEAKPVEKAEATEVEAPEATETEAPEIETAEAETAEAPEAEDDGLEAPGQWSKEGREIFKSLDSDVQAAILAEAKRGEALITRKSQELSESVKRWDALQGVLNPYKPEFGSAGLDEVGAVQRLLQIHDNLKRDPTSTVQWLAKQYGADLPAAQAEDQDEYASPEVSALKQQIDQQNKAIQHLMATQQQAQTQGVKSILDAFYHATDADGNPKHPYANDLTEDMTKMLTSGMASDLETAYDKALKLRPELTAEQEKAKVLSAKRDEALKKARAAADAKRRAAASGAKGGAGPANKGRMTMQESITAAFKR